MAFFVCELKWVRSKVPYRDCSEAEISDAGSPGQGARKRESLAEM